jgi:hypothetical protein
MSTIQPIYSDRVQYKLSHNPTGTQTTQEPSGWREDDNEFVRDKSFHGIFPQMTNKLTFYNDGAEFISSIYKLYGINADLILIKEERNPLTDLWETSYSGFLDLTTYEKQNTGVSIKFISSGLLRVIKARQNEKIEIDRLDTLKGEEIPYLEPSKVLFKGRNIFLKSLLETDPEESTSGAFRMVFRDGNQRTGSLGVPVSKTYSSDIRAHAVPKDLSFTTTPDEGRVEGMFYTDNNIDKTLNIKIKVDFNTLEVDIDDLEDATLHLVLAKFGGGTDYNIISRELLTPNLINNNAVTVPSSSIDIERDINLLDGESLALQWYAYGRFGSTIGINEGELIVRFENVDASINIEEDSQFFQSESKFHFPFEVCNRLLKIFTGKDDLLVSNVLGKTENGYDEDGEASLIGLTHGFWVRGFSKDDAPELNSEGENRYKSMTTSFKDFYKSYFDIWNLGGGVEYVGFKEVFRIEKLSYFYNKNITIRLGKIIDGKFEYVQVNNVRRSVDTDVFSSTIDIGYDKGGNYEEAVGLDEYNTRTSYTTIIDKLEKKYEAVSKYRADSYGMEFCRRFDFVNYATEDTKYDNSIWLLDLRRQALTGNGFIDSFKIFYQRLWQDDFESEPKGVFSPTTAQNLRLSPLNTLLRHGWRIGAGLVKYPLSFVRYGSSVANSGLITELKADKYPEYGGVSRAENGNIKASDLEKARTDGEIIEFDYQVDYDLLQKVRGKSVILGKEVQNFYGLVSFMNEDGQIEEGYLENLSPNGVGKWKLKKFNK